MANNEDFGMIMAMESMQGFWHRDTIEKDSKFTNIFFSEKSPIFVVTISILIGTGAATILIGQFFRFICVNQKQFLKSHSCTTCEEEEKEDISDNVVPRRGRHDDIDVESGRIRETSTTSLFNRIMSRCRSHRCWHANMNTSHTVVGARDNDVCYLTAITPRL